MSASQGRSRRAAGSAALIAATAALAGCQTTGTGGTDLSCRVFEPIAWSASDTVETVRQVRGHNAAWSALCDGSGP